MEGRFFWGGFVAARVFEGGRTRHCMAISPPCPVIARATARGNLPPHTVPEPAYIPTRSKPLILNTPPLRGTPLTEGNKETPPTATFLLDIPKTAPDIVF